MSKSVEDRIYTHEELIEMSIDDLDMLAFGVKGGDVRELSTSEISIVYSDLENPQYKFEQDGYLWVNSVSFEENVDVSVREGGKICLEDGHHRWFAADKLGRKIKAIFEIKANPIKEILARQKKIIAHKHDECDVGM